MKAFKWAGLLLVASLCGIAATRPIVVATVERMAVRNGPWRTNAGTGRPDANLYERAAVAIAGLYALSGDETLYYTAFTDSQGALLDGACDYRLAGSALPARWWSLTLYGADHYLVDNPVGIYSRHAGNLEFDADGRYRVPVSSGPVAVNGLPAPAQGPFSITLRLYNPAPAVTADLAGVPLPSIDRGDCR